jgi:hypothetical protein
LSILHSQSRKNHLCRRKNRMVQPDSLNVGFNALLGVFDVPGVEGHLQVIFPVGISFYTFQLKSNGLS